MNYQEFAREATLIPDNNDQHCIFCYQDNIRLNQQNVCTQCFNQLLIYSSEELTEARKLCEESGMNNKANFIHLLGGRIENVKQSNKRRNIKECSSGKRDDGFTRSFKIRSRQPKK